MDAIVWCLIGAMLVVVMADVTIQIRRHSQ